MKNFTVIAYPDENGYPKRETIIKAKDEQQAQRIAWRLFPEYHEVGVFEEKIAEQGERKNEL